MSRVLALAFLTVRSAVRSRLVPCLAALLLAGLAFMPAAVKGDGTAQGYVRVLLGYTLGFSGFVLAVATLWLCCGLIADDVASKRAHLVAVKPVRPWQIWAGRWLGALAINAALLCLAGLTVYATARWKSGAARIGIGERRALSREVLVGRKILAPRQQNLDAEAGRILGALTEQGRIKPGSEGSVLAAIRTELRSRNSVVPPGGSKEWVFDVPAAGNPDAEASLRFRFSTPSAFKRNPVSGTWSVGTDGEAVAFRTGMTNCPAGAHTVPVPAGVLRPGSSAYVRFDNAGIHPDGEHEPEGQGAGLHEHGGADTDPELTDTVMFSPESGVELLVREVSFERNLAMALFVMFCQLALLAALGTAVGAAFSFPVASFAAFSIVVVIAMMARYFSFAAASPGEAEHHHGHHHESKPSAFRDACGRALKALDAVTGPALEMPVERVADGIVVPGSLAGKSLLIAGLFYPAILAGLSSIVLGRKELGLPS